MRKKIVKLFIFLSFFAVGINIIYATVNNNKKIKTVLSEKYTGKKLERIKDTLKQKQEYRFLIQTTDNLETVKDYFKTGEQKAKIKEVGENNYIIRLPLNTNFLKDDLSLIDEGTLPTKIGIYDLIEPEIIESLEETSPQPSPQGEGVEQFLQGESIDNLWGIKKLGADIFQEELQTKEKIKVAVLDTGIDYNNPDLNDNYNSTLSYDFVNEDTDSMDDNGHGTQVAGIIGAEVNGEGIFGVNGNSDLISLKVLDANGIGTSYDLLEAINYAEINGIKVLNMSFGAVGIIENNPICEAIGTARNNGLIIVASAGNSNSEITNKIPAGCNGVITVGGVNENNEKSNFSNYGSGVMLYTPGENIYTTSLNNTYQTVNGTSFSAAFVSGLVAKELAYNPSISYDNLLFNIHTNYNLLSSVYEPLNYPELNSYTGTGEVLVYTGGELEVTFGEPGLFIAEGNLYPRIQSNGQSGCNRVETATFSNGYMLKNYTLSQNLTQNIGRTELYKDGILIEYQDNIFYSNSGYQSFSGNSCYLGSRFSSVILRDTGVIDINYNFWNGFSWQYGVKPTKFNINKKNVSDISITTSVFGYPKHFYVKLNLLNQNISSTINIASQGYLSNNWESVNATSGSWLWGSIYFSSLNPCIINNVSSTDINYIINYDCTVYRKRSSGAANGSSNTITEHIIGSFTLSKDKYDLCGYDSKFCICGNLFQPGETLADFLFRVNNGITYNEIIGKDIKGDPVNLHSGEFTYDNILMQNNSKGFPFEFGVSYKNKTVYDGMLGYNFDHSYNQYLVEQSDGNVYYYNGKLGVSEFVKNNTGFDYNKNLKANLEIINGKYNLKFSNSKTYIFNTDLKLQFIQDNFGNIMSFEYDLNGNLIKIIDTNFREYNLIYNTNGKLKNIIDFNGNKVEFIYYITGEIDGSENDLKTIKIINGTSEKEINYTYTIGTDDITSHNIIKLIDSENNIYVENTYNEKDRVISQKYGNGTIYYSYTIDNDDNIIENSVIDREGNNIVYKYDINGNVIEKIVKKSTGDITYNYEYNENNYIEKELLPLGNGYTYKYDLNNNLTEKRFKQNIDLVDSEDDIVTIYTYNQDFNKPIQIISPNGLIINFTLDTNGNITSKEILGVKDISGNNQIIVENYEYNLNGELIKKIDPKGNETSFEYTNGNLTKVIKGTGVNVIINEFNYDNKGNITSIIDGEGNQTQMSYNDFNLLNKITTPENIVSEYIYNNLNKKTNEKIILSDTESVDTSYEYDILDNPTRIITDIDSGRQKITVTGYDNNSNITEIKDGNNATVKFTYNEEGNITSKTIVNGTQNITTSYVYDENNRLIKQINPNNSEIIFEYDLYDRIIKQTLNNGVYTTLNYDKSGNILETRTYSSTGELLQKQSNTYDLLNRKISNSKYDLDNNITITNKTYYDVVGNIVKIVDAKQGETNYSYDSFDRLIQVTDVLGNIISNTYNKNNKLISRTITGTNGKSITTNYTYDSDNRLISETNNLNQIISYTYNNLNQVISKTDKDGIVTNYKYDYIGNLLEETIGTKVTKYEYDINGNRTKVIDSNNNITIYEYDSLNRLVKQTYPDGNYTSYEYDISGNLSKRTDPNGTVVINTYDVLNRLTGRTIQTGTGVLGTTSETYTYDELGRLTSGTDNQNNNLNFEYDNLNNLISETNSNELINYTYDINGNTTKITSPQSSPTGEEVATNYSYDVANRLISVKNGTQNIAGYTYDSFSQLYQTLGNGVTTNYSYDELLRLSNLGNYNYTYNTTGNITSDGKDNYTYDEKGQIIGVNYDKVNIPQYNGDKIERFFYDNLGNRTSQENYTLKEIQSETCTDETVVEDVTLPNGKTKTVERKVTNCTTATTQVEKEKNTLVYNSNSLNQYTKIQNLNKNDEVKKEFTYEYDKNGNLIKDDINRYVYDYKNRLIKVIQNEVIKVDENNVIIEVIPEEEIVSFEYDVLNRRIEKITQEETIKYIYAGQNAIKEIVIDNTVNQVIETRENIYSNNLDDILSTIITDHTKETPETNKYFYEKNHLGSITKITDEQGAIVEQYEYDVFGVAYASVNNVEAVTNAQNKKTLNIKKSNGSETANDGNTDELVIDSIRYKRYNGKGKIGNTRLYTGREYDSEIGLYYNRARYYNPDLGRFINRDPIDITDDVNLYAYVGNNGVMFVDRMGLGKDSLITIDEIIQDIAAKAILDGIWILGAITDLPNKLQPIKVVETPSLNISSYMLRKFMYGDGGKEYYGNEHWISQKLMKTDFYDEQIEKIKIYSNNNYNYFIENGYKDYGKGDLSSGLSTDFPTSFGTVDWTMTAKINQEGQIETNFSIKDDYIYNYHYADGSVITEFPNVFAKYYQDRGYGSPFKWELNIIETFNY